MLTGGYLSDNQQITIAQQLVFHKKQAKKITHSAQESAHFVAIECNLILP